MFQKFKISNSYFGNENYVLILYGIFLRNGKLIELLKYCFKKC